LKRFAVQSFQTQAASPPPSSTVITRCLVSFTEDPNAIVAGAARGERHVVFGIALAAGKRICIVGPRENIFHHLFAVEWYATVADLLMGLAPGTEHRRQRRVHTR